ncbi:MAG: MATE family efflux transporter [Chloroflexota bacterium]
MNETKITANRAATRTATDRTEADTQRIDRETAEAAALEVAAATDSIQVGGMPAMTASQAEELARGEVVTRPGESASELTLEERRDVSRSVFRLAWPAIAENALQTLLGIVDTAVVARLGTAALSGVGAAQQLVWVLTTALIAVSMGTTVLIARYVGGRERERANEVLKQSLILAAAASVLLTPVGFLSGPLMTMLGLTPEAARDGATYLSITLFASIFIVLMFVAGAALRGAGDTRTPMMVTAFINVINAVLAVEMVFGGIRASGILSEWLTGIVHIFGGTAHISVPGLPWIPELGVAGSAWATVISRGIGTVLLLSLFLLPKARLKLFGRGSWRPNFDIIGRMLKIGIPSALEQMFMSVGILVYSFLVIGMGEVIFATSRLALNAVFISQMPGFGFSTAATTLVGQSLGANSPKRALLGAQLSTRSAIIWMGIMGVVFFFFGETILRIFTDDPRLLELGGDALKAIAFGQPFLAVAFVLGGALRGAGDVRYPMWVTSIAVWLVRLPTGAFLGLNVVCIPFTQVCFPGMGLGLVGIYMALVVESALRALLMFVRFKGGKWQTMKV